MTFDPLRNGRSNRDRRDQAFARGVIAEATRRQNANTYVTDLYAEAYVSNPPKLDSNTFIDEWNALTPAEKRQRWMQERRRVLFGLVNEPEPDRCLMCNDALSGNCEIRGEHYPYCSARCSIEAERDSAEDA